ncbi:hypothetical protein LJC04_04060 [Ruminococcaceae bacterium OttesenSCG-928-O06]|nr:hypothetical protein [Ruminococcaceae bacterium OttesenSCG-928-O06]
MTQTYYMAAEALLQMNKEHDKKTSRTWKAVWQLHKTRYMLCLAALVVLSVFFIGVSIFEAFFPAQTTPLPYLLPIYVAMLALALVLTMTPTSAMLKAEKQSDYAAQRRQNHAARTDKASRLLAQQGLYSAASVDDLLCEAHALYEKKRNSIFGTVGAKATELFVILPATSLLGVAINPEAAGQIVYWLGLLLLGVCVLVIIKALGAFWGAVNRAGDEEQMIKILQEIRYMLHRK